MNTKQFTPDQQAAVEAHGDTLVVAGAGAGKTGTLVERCIRLLLDGEHPVAVSKILVVTFTEAAAAEVRKRIREELERIAITEPKNDWVQEQIADLDTAHICTLHSFCLALLRDNFYALEMDPAVAVLPGEQAEMLFHEVFEQALNEHFAGKHDFSGAVQAVMRSHFRGWEKPLREFIRKLHHYTQTRPGPEAWFAKQIEQLLGDGVPMWRRWYEEAVEEWCAWWAPYLASLPVENENARHCAELLQAALKTRDLAVIEAVLARRDCWPKGKKTAHGAAFGAFFEEAEFLDSLREAQALEMDWEWNAGPLLVLLRFAQQFSERYKEAKRGRGVVDFHDLEQGALRLLWDERSGAPTRIARRWQERLGAVFVDEYQDINAAQDLIISAVSRGATESESGNRFLVGDIKQSIYGFRQADPSIFRGYLRAAEVGKNWHTVFLSDNFRSHEGILNFINPLFGWLMRENVGGITYDAKAALKFGAKEGRTELAMRDGERMPVELHLLITSKESSGDHEEEKLEDLEAAEMEARIVALRLRELKEAGQMIHHRKDGERAVQWSDMVVLLRSASAKVEVYAKAFAAMGVPLETKRDGFFTAQEVLDLCSLLTILDNPLQDVPLLAVLRSPLVGMSANELAAVRIHAGKQVNFWAALNVYLKKQNEASRKIELFLERFHRWRDPKQSFSLAQRLETVLAETGYAEWLLSQGRGRQRYANVQQLLRVARQFDDARGESLYLFLRHIQELQESAGDIEPASISEANAVRLMTVHQSKGLEFPVVAVADLGKRFNTSDQNSSMQLHEKYGICAMIKPPEAPAQYKSLPLWLASREQKLTGLGEEMRVVYVALTRAENMLLLFGATTEKQLTRWEDASGEHLFPQQFLKTKSWLDWIGMHVNTRWPGCLGEMGCHDVPFAVRRYQEAPKRCEEENVSVKEFNDSERAALLKRITFEYPHTAAVKEPGKTSVSAVRKRMQRAEKPDEEVATLKRFSDLKGSQCAGDGRSRGLASHTFLQHVDLQGEFSETALRNQAEALESGGLLERDELDLIDWEAIAAFWDSKIGAEIRARWSEVRRELPFTFKLRNDDLVRLGVENVLPVPDGEFVVTQGVADLVVLGEKEIWLIDFKTDSVKVKEVAAKAAEYRGQIALYARALERIYGKPVTRRGLYFLTARQMEWLE